MAEAKLVVRYCASPPLSMSSNFGGIGGGGRSFRYRVDTTMSCLKPAFGSIAAAILESQIGEVLHRMVFGGLTQEKYNVTRDSDCETYGTPTTVEIHKMYSLNSREL
jgi:hypothetical protein